MDAEGFKARQQAFVTIMDAWMTKMDARVAKQTRMYEALERPMGMQDEELVKVQENKELTIGVVSPQTVQIVAIEDTLGHKDENINGFTVKVKSVYGFQGGEKDIIIISTCGRVKRGPLRVEHSVDHEDENQWDDEEYPRQGRKPHGRMQVEGRQRDR
ncbi:hypothetical protein JRO89_XS02G0191400 [Xanthoceras sorbifolium]|uniref:DNA2/NAM7 helicase-like C-terminal domain-containing protein n=1 Tax=Xanthoceras sorbifolium TaxID=99658 RepID=A0ABQ8IGQ0_9ROSI|nr:hypothetical protein JRO89_XS02G0191400 [Xanthoceras sorbifolium]